MDIVEHTVETRAGRIRLSDTGGQGMPLLCLHGSGASRAVFDRQLQSPLSLSIRMIALDLPGHGQSDDANDPQSTYTLTGLADCVDDVLRQLAIPTVSILGWSLGGHIAIELMSRSRIVNGVILAGTPPVARGVLGMLRGFHTSFDLLLASKQIFTPRDINRFEKLCFGDTADPLFRQSIERADGRLRAIFSQSMLRGDGADQRHTIQKTSSPVYLINGAEDPFLRMSYIEGFSDPSHPYNNSYVIKGAGHAPFWEKPDTFNLLIGEFAESVLRHQTAERDFARTAHIG